MIIVSQDKCTIVNLDNIKTIELDRETDFKSIIIFRETNEVEAGVCGLLIGHYTTRERAKEVLQEIIKIYIVSKGMSFTIGDAEELLGEYENEVYCMPEK